MLRIIFVLDGSGSINNYGHIFEQLKIAVQQFEMIESFQFSQRITSTEKQLNSYTNTFIAIEHLAKIIEASQEKIYLVMLVSDGLKNDGEDEVKLKQRFEIIHQQKNIYLMNIAVGNNFNKTFFDQMQNIVSNKIIRQKNSLILPASDNQQITEQFSKLKDIVIEVQNDINVIQQLDNQICHNKSFGLTKEGNQKDSKIAELNYRIEKRDDEQNKCQKKLDFCENKINQVHNILTK